MHQNRSPIRCLLRHVRRSLDYVNRMAIYNRLFVLNWCCGLKWSILHDYDFCFLHLSENSLCFCTANVVLFVSETDTKWSLSDLICCYLICCYLYLLLSYLLLFNLMLSYIDVFTSKIAKCLFHHCDRTQRITCYNYCGRRWRLNACIPYIYVWR